MVDGESDEAVKKEVDMVLAEQKMIPTQYQQDRRKMRYAVELITDWHNLKPEHFYSELEFSSFRLLVDCISEMVCERKVQTYNGFDVINGSEVIRKINECLARDGSMSCFVEETIDDYTKAAAYTQIKNVRQYMKSVIWTSLSAYKVKSESDYLRIFQNAQC